MFNLTSNQQNLLTLLCANFVVVHKLSRFNHVTESIEPLVAHTYTINNNVDITFQQDDTVVVLYNFNTPETCQVSTDEVTTGFIEFCLDASDEYQ